MLGYANDLGLIPRISKDLFDRIAAEGRADVSLRVCVSFMEIYNERVRDLLNINSEQVLRVRNHPKSGPYVGKWVNAVNAFRTTLTLLVGDAQRG